MLYVCKHCGNIVSKINDSGVSIHCCGEKMYLLEANTVDASLEKHVPVIINNDKETIINIGEVNHPMEESHYIEWIIAETDTSSFLYRLNPGEEPTVRLSLLENLKVVYAYCNLHGLWKLQVK